MARSSPRVPPGSYAFNVWRSEFREILAVVGTALMVFDQVRTFGGSLAGLQLAITQPVTLVDVIAVENVVGTIEVRSGGKWKL